MGGVLRCQGDVGGGVGDDGTGIASSGDAIAPQCVGYPAQKGGIVASERVAASGL